MTSDEIRLVKKSFSILNEDLPKFAENFYRILFDYAPLLKPMFSGDMKILEVHFSSLIKNVVINLENASALAEELISLGKKHRQFEIKSYHFNLMRTVFILALEYTLRGKLDSKTKQAWLSYYDLLSLHMVKGLESVPCKSPAI